jgi:sRNA-binding regulator protein Hfq
MNPTTNQYVKIIFKNSIKVEGFVSSWTDKEIVLKSEDSKRIMKIHDISEILVSVIDLDHSIERVNITKEQIQERIVQKIKELPFDGDKPSSTIDKLKDIAGLKKELAEQDKDIIQNKLKEHTISTTNKANYGSPNLSKIISSK